MKVIRLFYIIFFLKFVQNSISCSSKNDYYYGLKYFNPKISLFENFNLLNSEMACFNNSLNFTMGTNKPIFKSDSEAPARLVNLNPYCIDKTEVSNLQFQLFQIETSYVTQVNRFNLFF
jgi:hypothetical protein